MISVINPLTRFDVYYSSSVEKSQSIIAYIGGDRLLCAVTGPYEVSTPNTLECFGTKAAMEARIIELGFTVPTEED